MKKVLVLGSGAIVIGQGAEFDYSGTQACLAMKEEGYEVVLINNNPATIMTDKSIADKVYFEPLEAVFVEKIIEKEKPDMLLPTLGGQTGLNLAHELFDKGILEKYNVKVIGTSIETIALAEDREKFKKFLDEIGEPTIDSTVVTNVEDGLKFIKEIGYPAIVRPAYTLGGTGGGYVENDKELIEKIKSGTSLSIVNQVLIEKSLKGFKEIEYEVMRDSNGTCISVCNMENIDPVGIHTGDSIVVAPSQTLSDKEYQMLRTASLKIVDKLKIEGGCNVQIALDTISDKYYIIEVNPRVSRSSALASKATGYPIAKVATKIALGYNLHEIVNDITKKTYASYEPALDYCVVKIPRWPFDKLKDADNKIGTAMKATGEVMAIGNVFESALLKAVRALEISQYNLNFEKYKLYTIDELFEKITNPCSERLFYISELIRREIGVKLINKLTQIDLFFLEKIKNIVELEKEITGINFNRIDMEKFKELKKVGFSDEGISKLTIKTSIDDIISFRMKNNILPSYKMVDTCAGEFEAVSPYYYSTYGDFDEVEISSKKKVLVLGSGPIRIGQGVEFDYSTVKCLFELKNLGYESIVINNNPETVSTDFNVSDKLYFEPITKEDVMNIIIKEKPIGVILQFGGQTAVKLAEYLNKHSIKILGTDFNGINEVEDRDKFNILLDKNNIKHPKGFGVNKDEDIEDKLNKLNFPLLVRPSYVLGGQGMNIVNDKIELKKELKKLFEISDNNVLIDEYLPGIELEVDAITDGTNVLIPGIMEHLEMAGVHSGDSIAVYPTVSISELIKTEIYDITKKIAKSMNGVGLINIQFIYYKKNLYVLEVNPRASRTIPFISKVTNVSAVEVATKVMLGNKLIEYGIAKENEMFAVKGPIFSMEKLNEAEIALGPEMKSTGEILSVDKDFETALFKNFFSQNKKLYKSEKKDILLSVSDDNKKNFTEVAIKLDKLGYNLVGTKGTYEYFKEYCNIEKYDDEIDNLLFVVNIPVNGNDQSTKGFNLRRSAVNINIPVFTAIDTVKALIATYLKEISLE
ncbi:carbamoyl-phosphate synthase (glutamine-hydrolyzing) large subunit, partial [Clostridiaceae bacterium HSG29]|nr:carbamoyl-phosphate synthase (glutamine-hydrolyzing) large subunit [Clostridiaceae bacterium HSG29]